VDAADRDHAGADGGARGRLAGALPRAVHLRAVLTDGGAVFSASTRRAGRDPRAGFGRWHPLPQLPCGNDEGRCGFVVTRLSVAVSKSLLQKQLRGQHALLPRVYPVAIPMMTMQDMECHTWTKSSKSVALDEKWR